MSNQDITIRYVVYAIPSKRPLRQGTCTRKEFPGVVRSLDKGKERAKIVKNTDVELDLTPYDLWLGSNPPLVGDDMAKANLAFALMGKTIADAITSVDDIDTE